MKTFNLVMPVFDEHGNSMDEGRVTAILNIMNAPPNMSPERICAVLNSVLHLAIVTYGEIIPDTMLVEGEVIKYDE